MRAYQDLREFLSVLEREQQLLRITEQVKFEPDLAAAGCALARMGESSPAILFNNIAGCTDAQVARNVHGSWPNHALALGMDKDAPRRDQFFEFVRRFQQFPGEIERVTTAPWQDIAVEKNINLFELMPLFRFNRGDGGFYIDKACVVSHDPDDWDNDDVENVGIYRLMVKATFTRLLRANKYLHHCHPFSTVIHHSPRVAPNALLNWHFVACPKIVTGQPTVALAGFD